MKIFTLLAIRHRFYSEHKNIGAYELDLLERIGVRESAKDYLSVTDAMKLSDVGSPASIHRYIDTLEFCELIEKRFHGRDRRTKYLHLTPKSAKYFRKLEKAIENE